MFNADAELITDEAELANLRREARRIQWEITIMTLMLTAALTFLAK